MIYIIYNHPIGSIYHLYTTYMLPDWVIIYHLTTYQGNQKQLLIVISLEPKASKALAQSMDAVMTCSTLNAQGRESRSDAVTARPMGVGWLKVVLFFA